MCLKVVASDLSYLFIYVKVGYVFKPLEILYLHNVYYLKLWLIILIYFVTFTDFNS